MKLQHGVLSGLMTSNFIVFFFFSNIYFMYNFRFKFTLIFKCYLDFLKRLSKIE